MIEHKEYNPNRVILGDRVTVLSSRRYVAVVLGMRLDKKNEKVLVFLETQERGCPVTVDARDCYPVSRPLYPGHHHND